YLALYILGIYLGNKEFKGKRDIIFFYDGFTEIMQIGLFFILGLLSNFSAFIETFPFALAIMLFMTIIARPLSVYGLLFPFNLKKNQLNLISFAGIRGAAAIAFAIMAVNSGADLSVDIYHIVFGLAVLSALIQGTLMPYVTKRWDMLDPNDTVLKTFNFYQSKSEIAFLETKIHPESGLVGQKVMDLNLTFDFIVAKIERNGKTIVPRGHITIRENDLIILGGEKHFDQHGEDLIESIISDNHAWKNKQIKDIDLPSNHLIVMVQRGEHDIIVPVGDTRILEDDKVIMIQAEHSLDFPRVDEDDQDTDENEQEKLDIKK
ncbi:MAG TPA: TrkA C-terminal domain-containing protein, partial [Atopostipes sp.]|nr:TrkA C-terminal domain-containing protein [Atopostipes sp.]